MLKLCFFLHQCFSIRFYNAVQSNLCNIFNSAINYHIFTEDPAKENEELLAMVKAIFSQHKAKTTSMDIREFDEKFKKIYKKDFKTMSKLKISDFVEKNNRVLEIWTDKHQRKKIKLKFKKMSTKGKRKTNTVSLLDQTNKAEDSEDSDSINTESACQITENDGEALQDKLLENAYLESNKGKHNLKVSENLFDSDDDETPESKWTEVRRHKIRSIIALVCMV